MEALLVERLPAGGGWQFEPKWDGFRCLAFRSGPAVYLQSKSMHPLARYFPDVAELLAGLKVRTFVLDGELLIPIGRDLDFEELQLRLHPAASRVKMLSEKNPASLMIFDLLVDERGRDWTGRPLRERRPRLEAFAAEHLGASARLALSPATVDKAAAEKWLRGGNGGLDGVIAKRLDADYRSGERTGMIKVKNIRSADCVVGGFRYETDKRLVGSLLLGLYDGRGLLHHVGFTSGLKRSERPELTRRLEALCDRAKPGKTGFTGAAPGGPSRWSTERTGEWEPLPPELVVEVAYDHFTGGRFRHGTRLLRWRPDKLPRQCTLDQVVRRRLPNWLGWP